MQWGDFSFGKRGIGIDEILEAIVSRVPLPQDTVSEPLRALIFDSYYDIYRGVIVYFRVMDGTVKKRRSHSSDGFGKEFEIDELGVLSPTQKQVEELHAGEVGYVAAAIKAVADARVGDTITLAAKPARGVAWLHRSQADGFCGMFPIDAGSV